MENSLRQRLGSPLLILGFVAGCGLAFAGCSSDSGGGGSNDGGGTGGSGAGGSPTGGTGGTKATGGTSGTGGTGGTKATGGTAGTGGTKATGGTAGTGGTKATGGTANKPDGGDGGPGDGGDACVAVPLEKPTGVPAALAVPSGAEFFEGFHATGTQNYKCEASTETDGGKDYVWTFIGPVATLVDSCGTAKAKHFAGPAGASAPRWQDIADSSFVQGAKKASVNVAGSIPELLLTATDNSSTGAFSDIALVQRLHTTGGAAPDASTCKASTVNDEKDVDYTADYYFYSLVVDGGPDSGTDAGDAGKKH